MASLRKKPNTKFWVACYTDSEGRQRQRSTGMTDRRKAMKFAEELEQGHRQRISENAARKAFESLLREIHGTKGSLSMPINEFFRIWIEGKQVEATAGTWTRYRGVLTAFEGWLGSRHSIELATITTADIERYRNELARTHATGTVNLTLRVLSMALEDATKKGFMSANPVKDVRPISKRGKQGSGRRPFTVEELQKVLAVSDPEWRGMILAGLYTGQRLGDIATLLWSAVDLEREEIAITTRKTGRRVIIPIAAPLFELLMKLPTGDQPTAPLFPRACATVEDQDGRTGSLSNQFYRIMTDAGIVAKRSNAKKGEGRDAGRDGPSLGFHCLRYTATSMMKNAGINAATVQDIIGHDSAEISASYTVIESSAKKRALESMPDVTKGAK